MTRQLDVIDALLTLTAHEWNARPHSEAWFDYGQDALALVSRLRDAARSDTSLRTGLGERLAAFPPLWTCTSHRCAILHDEALAAMAAMAEDALADPVAQLAYVEMVQSEAGRSGQEHLAATVGLLKRSIALAPRISDADWRKGALVRGYYELQMFQRNGGHAAEADASLADLVEALSVLVPAGVLNADDRWCMARFRDPANGEDAPDACDTWAMNAGRSCFAPDPWSGGEDIALVSEVYRTSLSLFAARHDGTSMRDLIGPLVNRAAYSKPYCPQVRYYLGVALNLLEGVAHDDPGAAARWSENLPYILMVQCAPHLGECSKLRERALSVFRNLAEKDAEILPAYLERLLLYGGSYWRGPSNAWGERLILEYRALSRKLDGVARDIATRDGALMLAAIVDQQGRHAEARELVAEAVGMAQAMAERDPALAQAAKACSQAADGWTDLAEAELTMCVNWPKGGSMWAQ